ncbi:MAG TPA: C1 family peptidase [Candidatus Eremiobacteraceae bacterium]|nr:C1 family peptidase [Candidatus Eremiobacteraceae bacterium]
MVDDVIRIVLLALGALILLLATVSYVQFCYQEITGSGQVIIDPLSVVNDEGTRNDTLGTALAQMLQSDLESRASEFQAAQKELALTAPPDSPVATGSSSMPSRAEVVGNVRGWTPDVPLKMSLLRRINTGLLQPIDMKLSVAGMDVGGILPWLQRLLTSRRTLHFTLYSHADETEVFGSIAALGVDGPGIRLLVHGEDGKAPSSRVVVDRLAYEIFRQKLASDAPTGKVDLLKPEEFVSLASAIVKAGDANRESVGGRPVKDDFLEILPDVTKLCDAVPRWTELAYFAGWIADKGSDPGTAIQFYKQVLSQTDAVQSPDLYKYLSSHVAELEAAVAPSGSAVPEKANWSVDYTPYVREIRDSGQEGSVVGQALATAMEMQIKRSLHKDVEISPRYIYYAARLVEGTVNLDSGARIADAVDALAKQGAVEEAVWPYKAGEYAATPPDAVSTAARWRLIQPKSLKGLDAIIKALRDDGPVVVGIAMYQESMSAQAAKTGVIPLPQKSSSAIGGHAIVLVAYDDQRKEFKFVNDWGQSWGDKGYGYLSEDYIQEYSSDAWIFKHVVRQST